MRRKKAKFAQMDECLHNSRIKIDGPFGPHEAKMVCSECGKFVEWIPKDKTIRAYMQRQEAIFLLLRGKLDGFEKSFLSSIGKVTKLSPKQELVYQRIKDKYFPKKV